MLFSRCVLSERCGGACCQFHDLNILWAGEKISSPSASQFVYTAVSPSSRCSRCRVSTLSALTEVMQGVQGAQGARCGARGTSLLQASPPSTELRAQCAQRRWFPPDTDTRHQEQSPAPAFSPRHDNWYIDREFSMLRDIVLLILDISSYNNHVKILH